jgi:SNF2 family DNA or RNA helicase
LRLAENPSEKLLSLAKQFFDADGVIRAGAFAKFDRFLAESAAIDPDIRCQEDVLSYVAEIRDRDRRSKALSEAFPRGIDSPAFDKLVRVPLYDYQRQGALFAATAGRCLIGDEMGLGKTIQAIAAVEIMAKNFGVERVLIVCPTSLKHQWTREIEKFAHRKTQVIGGMRARREQNFAVDSFYKIINYDTVHRDLDLIAAWSPDLVILDEAQRIKNWNTRAARSVKRIESPYAIVLTGTPLENRLEELVSLVQFVDQHRLGPTFRFLADHQIRDPETGRVVGYKSLDTIGKTLEPILIRRQKSQVLSQLPGRLDKHLFVPMTPEQMRHHDENKEIVANVVRKWRKFHFLSETDQRRLMIALQNMRMSCDSTYLLDHETDFGVKADELATVLDEMYERPETKVVIFSQWLKMHELLVRRMKQRKWPHVLFHGGVPGPQRPALVDRFREDDACRAFLATDAGGVGLNLQHASVVVNMDIPWNPAVMEQRIGRVHRLGQKQPVQVVNFVAKGTIEEGMLSVLKFKKSLFAGALDGGDKEIFLGGSRLTKFIETVEKATSSIPASSVDDAPQPEPAPSGPGERDRNGNGDGIAGDGMESKNRGHDGIAPATDAAEDVWSGLLQTGLTLLEQLATASRSDSQLKEKRPIAAAGFVGRDDRTGENYLKIPMPKPEILDKALSAIGALLERFKK